MNSPEDATKNFRNELLPREMSSSKSLWFQILNKDFETSKVVLMPTLTMLLNMSGKDKASVTQSTWD